ncbi:MAG: tRNA lysidine(34) synthetase TilS [Anaerolineales bacterium]
MLETILQNQCGLDPAKPVVAGVSGGPDSLCLLDILNAVGYRVIVAHFNHQLRPEADLEAAAVADLAHSLGLPFITDHADVRQHADEHGLSLEEAARMLRYRFLFAAARKHAAQAVAVGHTADDQVETILMHFLRGAGLPGLKGMEYRILLPAFDPRIPLVRPLLSLWRADTESYCHAHGLEPHFDASNADQTYFRNRLRHALIPDLQKYNPRFKEALLRSAQALQGDYVALQEAVEQAWKAVVIEAGKGWVAFDQAGLESLSAGLRRNIIRRAAESLRPDSRDFGFEALERAAAFAGSPAGRQIDFVNGLYLFVEKGKIHLAAYEADIYSTQWPQVMRPSAMDGQQVELGNGWVLAMKATSMKAENWRLNANAWSAWLDADQLPADGLVIRPRRAGDVFCPLGMGGQMLKVQDFYSNVKIPRRARAQWPLVCAGEQVVWVTGYRIGHSFRITEKTEHALHLEIKKFPQT